jgi:hypothetical protein
VAPSPQCICIKEEEAGLISRRCRSAPPPRRMLLWGLSLLLGIALAPLGCATPTYEQTHDSLSALSSVLGAVATVVPGGSAVGLAGHSLSAANTLTRAAVPGSPSHSSSQQGRETIYDSAYQVKGYFEYEGEIVRVFDRDGHLLGYADTTGTYDTTGHRISPNSIPGLLLGKS